MSILSKLSSLTNYTPSLVPEHCDSIVVVTRLYDLEFVNNYIAVADSGGFAKGGSKAFPVHSRVQVLCKSLRRSSPEDPLYEYVLAVRGLENGCTLIPEGVYEMTTSYSSKFRKVLPGVCDVPKRSGIRIHAGNYPSDSSGCLLLGSEFRNGILSDSTKAMTRFTEAIKPFSSDLGRMAIAFTHEIDFSLPF